MHVLLQYNTLQTKENLKYQVVAGIGELMDLHNKLQNINEGDTELLAVSSVLDATLGNACQGESIIITDKSINIKFFIDWQHFLYSRKT